jgi:hypothetical protein
MSMNPFWNVCDKDLNFVSMCAVSLVVHTSNISSCQKNFFFSFLVAMNHYIQLGPLVFLLYIFVITENIMKRPVLFDVFMTNVKVKELNAIYKDKTHWTILINKKVWCWLVNKAAASYLENLHMFCVRLCFGKHSYNSYSPTWGTQT